MEGLNANVREALLDFREGLDRLKDLARMQRTPQAREALEREVIAEHASQLSSAQRQFR